MSEKVAKLMAEQAEQRLRVELRQDRAMDLEQDWFAREVDRGVLSAAALIEFEFSGDPEDQLCLMRDAMRLWSHRFAQAKAVRHQTSPQLLRIRGDKPARDRIEDRVLLHDTRMSELVSNAHRLDIEARQMNWQPAAPYLVHVLT